MPLLEPTEESEAVGLWGACHEIFEEKIRIIIIIAEFKLANYLLLV